MENMVFHSSSFQICFLSANETYGLPQTQSHKIKWLKGGILSILTPAL